MFSAKPQTEYAMLATLYFPYVSMLASASTPEKLIALIAEGRIQQAIALSSTLSHVCTNESLPALLQLHGDLQLCVGMDVDADESYREAQKLILASKDQTRYVSCRHAGWQALFRHRFGTAMACFSQLIDQPHGNVTLQFEGLFGAFGVLFALGRLQDARAALDSLAEILERANNCDSSGHSVCECEESVSDRPKPEQVCCISRHQLDGWHELVRIVRFDLATQSALRSKPALEDHVYWQTDMSGEDGSDMSPEDIDAGHQVTVSYLLARMHYLQHLTQLAEGDREAGHKLNAHLDWAGKQAMVCYQSVVRIEIALASLAGGALSLAENTLAVLGADRTPQSHRQVEYLYCLAKLRNLQGSNGESLKIYRRYALTAMRCIRDDACILVRYLQRGIRTSEQLDDIGARLPARYRRAYQYLLDNLERKDLSIREISATIGVTDRALQTAFKTSLGSTPSEIIRRLRMERIRAELEAAGGVPENGILETAIRWGISNRSTLLNSYRREFNEAPSDTLNR